MKNIAWIIAVLGAIIFLIWYFFSKASPQSAPISKNVETINTNKEGTLEKIPAQQTPTLVPFSITSPAFSMNESIPVRFTCDGENISPELVISGTPERTQSLVLTLEDPDVPKNIRADGMWDHWIIWNIPPNTTRLKESAVPPGILGTGTNGKTSYLGPCPPDREHRYIFTLYALDTSISLPKGSKKEQLLRAMDSHIIKQTNLIGHYNRN